jgi:hypothetical protein
MKNVGIFYAHLVFVCLFGGIPTFMVIWYIFLRIDMFYQKNLATLVCTTLLFSDEILRNKFSTNLGVHFSYLVYADFLQNFLFNFAKMSVIFHEKRSRDRLP